METIKNRRSLHRKVKEILEASPTVGMSFPQIIVFSAGVSDPEFRITIEMIERDHFFDDKGQKWVRA